MAQNPLCKYSLRLVTYFAYLPTINNSVSDGDFLTLFHISMVKIVDEELNSDVSDVITAANITASINPARPKIKP